MKKILLVEPAFPIPPKSKNHKNFLPIGLLKIASYLRFKKIKIRLVRGAPKDLFKRNAILNFRPDEIWVTSLFTYWAEYVKEAVESYKNLFPKAKILVGGIYASLMKEHCKKFTGCDEVVEGIIEKAEKFAPAYDLVENLNPHKLDYQIIHASRGCDKKCSFCGTWKIEPKYRPKKSIKNEIIFRKIVFYDNNFLANPNIKNILEELIELKEKQKILWCESQSGFDGGILNKQPIIAEMLKKAGFRYPRIAWDWNYEDYQDIEKQIYLLINIGYRSKDIYIFVLYNWDISFEEMELKRKKCWQWKIQIADCRFRPLKQVFDKYRSRIKQSGKDYYIHPNWSDEKVKLFRKNIRRQNICIRQDIKFHSGKLENKQLSRDRVKMLKHMNKNKVKKELHDVWFPES